MDERIVVVGGNSYIGRYFADYAAARGSDVLAVGSKECDLLDAEATARFFASLGDRPCAVVFLAVINKHAENSPRSFFLNNQIAQNFLDGHRRADVRSVVWFSSVDVYGARPRLPITEETPIAPDTWYGLAKYTTEWMVATSGAVACPVTVLRIPGIYGRAPNDRSVVAKMVAAARERGRVVVSGTGRSARDLVYIDDVARLVRELLPMRHRGVLNVATGTSLTVLEIARLVREALGGGVEVVHGDADPGREFDLRFDIARLAALLPSFRFTALDVGIRSYLDHRPEAPPTHQGAERQ